MGTFAFGLGLSFTMVFCGSMVLVASNRCGFGRSAARANLLQIKLDIILIRFFSLDLVPTLTSLELDICPRQSQAM